MIWRRMAQEIAGGLSLALLASACGGDEADPTPTTTTTATAAATVTAAATSPTPTVASPPSATPDPEAEVLAAYADYWEVYIDALSNRDASRLDEVMIGPRLERGLQEVADLHAQSRAVQLVVENSPVLLEIRGNLALISDEYENNSYYIDPVTKQPLGATPVGSETLKDLITLQRVDGVWKVHDGVREEPSQ